MNAAFFWSLHVQCGNHKGEVMKMTKTEADSLNMNSLTSCMTHVTAPIQVDSTLFTFKSQKKYPMKYCFCVSPGEVSASMIINYLQSMTAQSTEQERLAVLQQLLDPKCRDPPVSKEAFHSKMREWITHCSQDRWDSKERKIPKYHRDGNIQLSAVTK